MYDRLKGAIQARLPLISVTTRDRVNAAAVIHHLTGESPHPLAFQSDGKGKSLMSVTPSLTYYVGGKTLESKGFSTVSLYREFQAKESSLIVLNPVDTPSEFFDAGPLPTPPGLVLEVLKEAAPKAPEQLAKSLGGLTLKEVSEVYRLTELRDGAVTPKGLSITRKELFKGVRGLQPVDTYLPLYWPQEDLEAYAGPENEWYFLQDEKNPRLHPRGLMLTGGPGVGKTAYWKWLAGRWGVPLYRLNVRFHGKYVGDSQEYFESILQQIEEQAPCILLIDEIEKIFGAAQQRDSSSQMVQSLLLWWLQERTSRVLVGMTCNRLEGVPPEIFREGRVDDVITVKGLTLDHAVPFATALVDTFDFDVEQVEPYAQVETAIRSLYIATTEDRVPHGRVEQEVVRVMKSLLAPKPANI